MNFLDAAYSVLSQAGEPLHYVEITNRAVAQGLLETKGQTPEASMGSRLYVDTKRDDTRFRRVGRNVFGLVEGTSSEIRQQIDLLNLQARSELRKQLMSMPPDRFEALIGLLLLALGFDENTVHVTSYGGDGGVDVRGVLNAGDITEVNAAVQVKRWKRNIQTQVVQALRGSLVVHEQGIIITTSRFSKGAQEEAQAQGKARISLVDGEKLLDLLILHKIGVEAQQYTVISLDRDWWGDVTGTQAETVIQVVQDTRTVPEVTYPVTIQATAHNEVLQGELLDANGRVRYNGTEYKSPSGAGQVATGWVSCNGWSLWRYKHPVTGEWRAISELRGG